DGSSRVNVVNNYFKPGPATPDGALRYRICRAQARNEKDQFPGFGKWYVAGNVVDGDPKVTADNWAGGVQDDPDRRFKDMRIPAGCEKAVRALEPFPAASITQQSAAEAYELVLAYAGASWPRRDAVDARVIESVRTGKPTFKNGIIDTPADVGGWPAYRPADADVDSGGDGMPGWRGEKYGLNPNNPSDANQDRDGDGYTNLEEYLNGTDPTQFVDYTKPENNKNVLHQPARSRGSK